MDVRINRSEGGYKKPRRLLTGKNCIKKNGQSLRVLKRDFAISLSLFLLGPLYVCIAHTLAHVITISTFHRGLAHRTWNGGHFPSIYEQKFEFSSGDFNVSSGKSGNGNEERKNLKNSKWTFLFSPQVKDFSLAIFAWNVFSIPWISASFTYIYQSKKAPLIATTTIKHSSLENPHLPFYSLKEVCVRKKRPAALFMTWK